MQVIQLTTDTASGLVAVDSDDVDSRLITRRCVMSHATQGLLAAAPRADVPMTTDRTAWSGSMQARTRAGFDSG